MLLNACRKILSLTISVLWFHLETKTASGSQWKNQNCSIKLELEGSNIISVGPSKYVDSEKLARIFRKTSTELSEVIIYLSPLPG